MTRPTGFTSVSCCRSSVILAAEAGLHLLLLAQPLNDYSRLALVGLLLVALGVVGAE